MILFFARDPGAASALLPVYEQLEEEKVLWGKDNARSIFQEAGVPFRDFNDEVTNQRLGVNDEEVVRSWLRQTLSGFDCSLVVTGTTGLDDYTDRLLWKIAESSDLPSLVILDQWERYVERITGGFDFFRPTFVASPDSDITRRLNELGIPKDLAVTVCHPALVALFENRKQIELGRESARDWVARYFGCSQSTLILFASQPIQLLKSRGSYYEDVSFDESDVFELFMEGLEKSQLNDYSVVIKLHPSDEDGSRYRSKCTNILRDEISKFSLLAAGDIVVGASSMLLIEAVVLGKQVVSLNPEKVDGERLITSRLGLNPEVRTSDEMMRALDQPNPSGLIDDKVARLLGLHESENQKVIDFIQSQSGAARN